MQFWDMELSMALAWEQARPTGTGPRASSPLLELAHTRLAHVVHAGEVEPEARAEPRAEPRAERMR